MIEAIKCKHCKSFIERTFEKAEINNRSNIESETQNVSLKTSFDVIDNNAYRILGLSAEASQRDIHEANSSIRRAIKIGVNKTTSWDLPWLGSTTRTEKDLQAAIGKLTNPAQRLHERLFWFSGNAAPLNEATIESLSSAISEFEARANSHDLALVKLVYANLIDPELKNKNLWIGAITLWEEVIDSDDYWPSLLDMDMVGEFEPFATIEEVENLKLNVYRLICSKLLALANEGVVTKNEGICKQVFNILRDSKIPRNIFYEFETQVFGSLEDEFIELCEQIRNDSNNSLNKQDTNALDNIKTCTTALNRFNNEVQPGLNRLLNLSGQNTELANRVKEEAAGCLRGI